jgi:hypothetical protein
VAGRVRHADRLGRGHGAGAPMAPVADSAIGRLSLVRGGLGVPAAGSAAGWRREGPRARRPGGRLPVLNEERGRCGRSSPQRLFARRSRSTQASKSRTHAQDRQRRSRRTGGCPAARIARSLCKTSARRVSAAFRGARGFARNRLRHSQRTSGDSPRRSPLIRAPPLPVDLSACRRTSQEHC